MTASRSRRRCHGAMMAQRPEITWKYLLQIERNCRGARTQPRARGDRPTRAADPGSDRHTQNVDGSAPCRRQPRSDRDPRRPAQSPLHPLPLPYPRRHLRRARRPAAVPDLLAFIRPVSCSSAALPRRQSPARSRLCRPLRPRVFDRHVEPDIARSRSSGLRVAAGTPTVEINLSPTGISRLVDHAIRCRRRRNDEPHLARAARRTMMHRNNPHSLARL